MNAIRRSEPANRQVFCQDLRAPSFKLGAGFDGGEAPRLVVLSGAAAGDELRLSTDRLDIGRAPDAGLRIKDAALSRRHCRLVREDGEWAVEDLGSRNGTYIGEQRIEERTLIGPGSIFVVGNTLLEFMQG